MSDDLAPKAFRNHVKVFDSPAGDRWRGALVTSFGGGTATLSVLVEAGFVRTFTGPSSDLPAGAGAVGEAVCVRVIGAGALTYSLAEIRASEFDSRDGVPSD